MGLILIMKGMTVSQRLVVFLVFFLRFLFFFLGFFLAVEFIDRFGGVSLLFGFLFF